MGTSITASGPFTTHAGEEAARVDTFFGQGAWIEGAALGQLDVAARLPGVSAVAAFPDLHPGRNGPVGACILSDRVLPLLIGNDIGCGMAMFELDLPLRKLRVDKAADRLRTVEGQWDGDAPDRLVAEGLPPSCFARSLGTIGGGNHFCELQAVEEAYSSPSILDATRVHLLVHSGSRAFGEQVVSELPGGAVSGLARSSSAEAAYLAGHAAALLWARLNRLVIAERVAEALRADVRLVSDVPHNLVRATDRGFVHHKGAAFAQEGSIVPVAGSRDSLSFVVRALAGIERSLGGISHGAGRKYDRAAMHHRVGRTKSDREAMTRNRFGGVVVCEDRDLLLEEAGSAYKDAARVVDDLVGHGLVERLASMRPLVTFKRAREEAAFDLRDSGRNRR
jgi:release factor H-coupled RctB family protein